MKTAISIPDELFEEADLLAHELRRSRSGLYAQAIREYIVRHHPDRVTEALDALCDEIGSAEADFARTAARATLEQVEW
jgi:metal-responsive CopG/Arc/MetJ family transcriptional regulator